MREGKTWDCRVFVRNIVWSKFIGFSRGNYTHNWIFELYNLLLIGSYLHLHHMKGRSEAVKATIASQISGLYVQVKRKCIFWNKEATRQTNAQMKISHQALYPLPKTTFFLIIMFYTKSNLTPRYFMLPHPLTDSKHLTANSFCA
jgi:hypothetical protein